MVAILKPCTLCDGEHWVCKDHPDLPYDSYHQANCSGGLLCICSPYHPNHLSEEDRLKLEELERRPEMFNGKKVKP